MADELEDWRKWIQHNRAYLKIFPGDASTGSTGRRFSAVWEKTQTGRDRPPTKARGSFARLRLGPAPR